MRMTRVPVRLTLLPVFAVVLGALTATPARAGGNANFFLGEKYLKESDWSPVENQPEFGAEVTFGKSGWPVQIAIDALSSIQEKDVGSFTFRGKTSELAVGVRKIWNAGRIHPYVGGGLASITAERKETISGVSDDDAGLGGWIGGGVFFRLGHKFNIGVSGRLSRAKAKLFGSDIQAGGSHVGVLLGWGWPGGK